MSDLTEKRFQEGTLENKSVLVSFVSATRNVGNTDNLLSDHVFSICLWVIFAVVCQTVDVFGTVTNIINIICFVKQGFKDPINVSFLGLAISDLACLLPLVWSNIFLAPAFSEADLPFVAFEVQYLTGVWPHITFTRISSWITALITLERCLCITVPLKVKNIVTSKRVAIITVCLITLLTVSVAPVYVVNGLGMRCIPEINKTLLGIVFTANREIVEKISFAINNIFISFSAFIVIIVCTVTLVINLKRSAQWRKKTTIHSQADNVSNRNQKTAKMVVIISSFFIACFFPVAIIFITMSIESNVSLNGKYRNIAVCLGGFGFVMESVNSSMNIFIYYQMSSRYRTIFRQLFCNDTNH